jgi:hypothetical protein
LELESLVSKTAENMTGFTYSFFKTSSKSGSINILAYKLLVEPVRESIRERTTTYNKAVWMYQYLEIFIYTLVSTDILLFNP